MEKNIKTSANQKVVKVSKEVCDKGHLYATINLEAMSKAACDLDAGAFKLWCYFAKNQNGYEFALSSKDVGQNFGMKIKQYNNAVKELIDKGYLVISKGNNYIFYEISVITKEDKGVITKEDNPVITFEDKGLLPLELTNNIDITINNTEDITEKIIPEEKGTIADPHIVSREWLIERRNELVQLANGLFKYGNSFYKMG
jgi:archaellin